jgi:hypothetical protein
MAEMMACYREWKCLCRLIPLEEVCLVSLTPEALGVLYLGCLRYFQ